MAVTRNKPDMERNPSAGSYYKAVFISMYSQSYTPSKRIKHLPCDEKSKWEFSLNYYNSDAQGTQKVAFSGKSFPDATGQQLLTALKQPIQSYSYCGPQTKSNDACSPLRIYGVGKPRVHFFPPLGGSELAVQLTPESEHLHLCLTGGQTIDLNHFNKSRF